MPYLLAVAAGCHANRGELIPADTRYVAHHDFTAFAWYRIALGAAILAALAAGKL